MRTSWMRSPHPLPYAAQDGRMDDHLVSRLHQQEQRLREVAELLARATAEVDLIHGVGWQGNAAEAFRMATEQLRGQLADASVQVAGAVANTMVLARGWGPRD